MRCLLKKSFLRTVIVACAFFLVTFPAAAGDTILSNNSGVENAVFYIEDEASLVVNGFDLTPLELDLPIALDTVSISVNTPVPGSSIDLVVYQDGNGGSPLDATLVYWQQVTLEQTGINRITLDEAAIITEPVVWVGFNLPVGFQFNADRSGSSVLTYWAWTTGGTFDLASLGGAGVLGPGDGSEPVGISMDGIARITAELRTPQYEETAAAIPLGQQLVADVGQDTSIMRLYEHCDLMLFDPEDISITANSSFTLDCVVEHEINAPTSIAQPQGQYLDLQRAGHLYKLSAHIPEALRVEGAVSTLPVRVTHCLRIAPGDLARAVIGEARGIPEKWHILPSVRFNDIVCAEVTVANYISYFLPRTAESPPNVNLVLRWARVDTNPLQCGIAANAEVQIVNTGQSSFETDSGTITLVVEDIHIRTGILNVLDERSINTEKFGPGERRVIELGPFYSTIYSSELHRLQVRVDADNEIGETNESDNSWFTEYVLAYPDGSDECAIVLVSGS